MSTNIYYIQYNIFSLKVNVYRLYFNKRLIKGGPFCKDHPYDFFYSPPSGFLIPQTSFMKKSIPSESTTTYPPCLKDPLGKSVLFT